MKILIAYYSNFGNTFELASAVKRGILAAGDFEVTISKISPKKENNLDPNQFDLVFLGGPVVFELNSQVRDFGLRLSPGKKVAVFSVGLSKVGFESLKKFESALVSKGINCIETIFIKKNVFQKGFSEISISRIEGFGEKIVSRLMNISTKRDKEKSKIKGYK
jgi:flavodoxin